jgi:hypothetical protein
MEETGGRVGTPLHPIDAGDQRRFTAFHVACASGHAECVALLLKSGCDTALVCDVGLTGWGLAKDLRRTTVLALQKEHRHQTRRGGGGSVTRSGSKSSKASGRGAEKKAKHSPKGEQGPGAAANAPLLSPGGAEGAVLAGGRIVL